MLCLECNKCKYRAQLPLKRAQLPLKRRKHFKLGGEGCRSCLLDNEFVVLDGMVESTYLVYLPKYCDLFFFGPIFD